MMLPATVQTLRQMGVKRIILVGPVPHWNHAGANLPEAIEAYSKVHAGSTLPARMDFGLDPTIRPLDQRMQKLADRLRITYISPLDTLCNDEGCLTLVPGSNNIPMAWDAAHFTREASRYFIDKIADSLFGDTVRQTRASAQ